MPDQAAQDRATNQARSSVWTDGKRRVTVAQPTRIVVGRQVVVKTPDQVIDDEYLISLLEDNDVELIDLDVNGRPALSKKQQKAIETARFGRIDALANALGVMPNVMRDALESGKPLEVAAVRDSVDASFTKTLRDELAAAQSLAADLLSQLEALKAESAAAIAAAAASAVIAAKDAEVKSATKTGPSFADLSGS